MLLTSDEPIHHWCVEDQYQQTDLPTIKWSNIVFKVHSKTHSQSIEIGD